MAIALKTTRGLTSNSGVKLLVYGESGAGKTTLIGTLQDVVVLSAEAGLLALSGADVPYIEIGSIEALQEAYRWLASSEEAKRFKAVALDSISEIAEVVLSSEKKATKDGRAAYGEMNATMADAIRAFRDLPGRHIYMTAKLAKTQDETGRILYGPSMPGKTLTQQLPYFFDEVLALRVERDGDGVVQRMLQCASDGLWTAKDRSGWLDTWELPDLGAIIAKIAAEETRRGTTEEGQR